MAGPKIKSMNLKHPLITTDKGIRAAGLLDQVIETLKKTADITKVTVFDDVKPNPTQTNVLNGLNALNASDCDVIISLGGGSAQDCAKAVALVKTNGGKIEVYQGTDLAKIFMFPLAINTTAGTASEVTRSAVITNESPSHQSGHHDRHVYPMIAVSDAALMMKQPKGLTAATGMDALTHGIEAYISNASSLITDACALQAIRLINKHLATAVFHGDNIAAREGMAYAEFLAGIAFNSAGLGYVHAMSHQMGAVYDLPHGVCNAILLPHVREYNKTVCAHCPRDVGEAMGVCTVSLTDAQAADEAIAAIRALSVQVEIPAGFRQLGAKEKDFPHLADVALKDGPAPFNPRQGTKEDIMKLFAAAM